MRFNVGRGRVLNKRCTSGPLVGNCSSEKSCAQCEFSHPSPRQNLSAGMHFLYLQGVS
jgi:hypothetical protein